MCKIRVKGITIIYWSLFDVTLIVFAWFSLKYRNELSTSNPQFGFYVNYPMAAPLLYFIISLPLALLYLFTAHAYGVAEIICFDGLPAGAIIVWVWRMNSAKSAVEQD